MVAGTCKIYRGSNVLYMKQYISVGACSGVDCPLNLVRKYNPGYSTIFQRLQYKVFIKKLQRYDIK